jgi:hypothetical protein
VVVGGDFWLNATHWHHDATSTGISYVVMRPAADYFVIDHFSIGGAVLLYRSWSSEGSYSDGVGLVPRIGYEVPLAESFSLWPRAGIDYEVGWAHTADDTKWTGSGRRIDGFVEVPLLAHVTRNFFIGIGPRFSTELNDADGLVLRHAPRR